MQSSRRVALIVEDQPFVGMVASDILKEAGFETFHAYDGQSATQLLDEHPEIELMLTEAELPGEIGGVELCQQVSRQRPEVQLVVTATAPELHLKDVPTGARVLRKPYASGELRMLVGDKALLASA